MPLHLLDWTCDGVDHRRVSVPVAYTEIWIGAAGGLCAASQERRNNLVQLFLRRRRRMGFARQNLFVETASYFDREFRHLRDRARFLSHLVKIMSRPVMPTDEDYEYLPTQAVAEYLSDNLKLHLDGLIFPSSQRDGNGENVVLFRHVSTVAPDGSDGLDMEVDFGSFAIEDYDPDITVWIRKKSSPRKRKDEGSILHQQEQAYFFDDRTVWKDLEQDPPVDHSLRVEVDSIEVGVSSQWSTKRRSGRCTDTKATETICRFEPIHLPL